jgi:hypothetical protein
MAAPSIERATMDIPEYCQRAGIGVKLGYELAKSNALGVPVLRFGRRIVLPRAAALRLLQTGETAKS